MEAAIVGSGSYEQSWRAIPTQRPGPETRNTVILGCYTRNSNFRDSSGEIIMFMFGVEPNYRQDLTN